MNKSVLFFLVVAGFQLPVQAKSANSCQQFYLFNRAWLSSQSAKVRSYVRNSKQEKAIENILLTTNKDPRDLVSPLETETFTIQIVDQGLAAHTPVEVIMTDKVTKETQVLLSSLKLQELRLKDSEKRDVYAPTITKYLNDNTVLPVGIQLSPLRDYLIVKVSSEGSIDGHTLAIIDLKTKKIIQEIENAGSNDVVWISPTQFTFRTHEVGIPVFMGTIVPNGVKVEPSKLGRMRSSNDQQWYYNVTPQDGLVLVSTISGQKFRLPDMEIVDILPSKEESNSVWIKTNGTAGFMELVKVDLQPGMALPKTIVKEGTTVIDKVIVGKEYVQYDRYLGADRWVNFIDHNGKLLAEVKAPDCCAISGAKYDAVTQTVTMVLQSPVTRRMNWTFDLRKKEWIAEDANTIKAARNPGQDMMIVNGERFITRYESYRSKDGTMIPIRITFKEGAELSGKAPTLMEGYGGFALNNYFHPAYERMTFEFIKSGGVHLAPALRGSYFFGEKWHEQGRGLKKQNVIDDFIGAAEWAIANGFTIPDFLAISGASHGGLLVAAAITQRPDLFGLAFPQYGPNAFHDKPDLDPISTPLQKLEYADLISDPIAQENARTISPELRAVKQKYPMTVVITGRRDSRVNPIHSYRFFDKLRQNQTGDQPILLYTQNNSGHWMTSIPRQDFLGWRSRSIFWSVLFKKMNMDITP
ncbi:MAG: S9 family peptidase [Bdellovibrionaceae bacterium]|nr:S9 family peptidase [Pseudobdellovibrionaceae bacterium]